MPTTTVAPALEWEHNCWTGNAVLRVSANERIVRIGDERNDGSDLYYAEYWGPYPSTPVAAGRSPRPTAH